LQGVSFQYAGKKEYALKNVDFNFQEGEIILFTGASGSGKTTLLNLFNGMIPYFFQGILTGQVFYKEKIITEMPKTVGTVFQDPNRQLVYKSVLKELVFGLENLGLSPQEMKRRIGELVSFLGIENLLDKQTDQLSGGEKQLISIASVLATRPEVLILDEPTAQLDPASAEKVFNLVQKINKDLGVTILISEQRIDKCYDFADQIVYLERGRIIKIASPKEMVEWQVKEKKEYIPTLAKLFAVKSLGIPLTVREGKRLLKNFKKNDVVKSQENSLIKESNLELLNLTNVSFSYDRNKPVLKKINLKIAKGEFVILSGANGAGKTTLINVIAGLLKPSEGNIKFKGKKLKKNRSDYTGLIGYLPQNLSHYFFKETVREELMFNAQNANKTNDLEIRVNSLISKMGLTEILDYNPRDLSMGEKQKTALVSILASEPELIILDEPTKGLDQESKKELGQILTSLSNLGITVIVVTHDLEFAADYGKRMIMMFKGEIVSDGSIEDVLQNNWFYTTQLNLVFKDKTAGIINFTQALKFLEEQNA